MGLVPRLAFPVAGSLLCPWVPTCFTAGTRRVALPRPLGEGIFGPRAGSALSFVRWWLRASDTPARFFVWTAAPGGVASRHLHVLVVWMAVSVDVASTPLLVSVAIRFLFCRSAGCGPGGFVRVVRVCC